jgi:uncharacterized protein YjdB
VIPQRRLHWLAVAAALSIAIACTGSNSGVGPALDTPVYAVLVTPKSANVSLHGTRSFTAIAHGAGGDLVPNVTFVWASSNPAVATVDQTGRLTAVDTGDAQITASAQGISAVANVVVTPPPVDSIVVTPPLDTILLGSGQVQLSDTVKDQYGEILSDAVTWTSSSAHVAIVSSTGLITLQGAGTATISASAGGKSGTSTIVVEDTVPGSISLQVSPDSVFAIPNPMDYLVQLTATVKNATGWVLSNYPVVFTSSNGAVSGLGNGPVTVVGGSELVVPQENGTAVITAVAGRFAAQASLTVCYAASSPICNPLANIYLTPAVDTVAVGDSIVMDAVGVDSLGNTYPFMGVEWDRGQLVSSDSSFAIAVAPSGTVYAVNPGTQYVEGGIAGFYRQAVITVLPAPATPIVTTADLQLRRAHMIAAVTLLGARQRAAHQQRLETMQQILRQRMRTAPSQSMKTYYAGLITRLATSPQSVTAIAGTK